MLTRSQVAAHNTRQSCWVIIDDKVYDVTSIIGDHPGGAAAILRHAGKDATKEYLPIHPSDTMDRHIPKDKHLGSVDRTGYDPEPETSNAVTRTDRPITASLHLCQNLLDIEDQAARVLNERALTYFRSAADSCNSLKRNAKDWSRVTFRPRVLRNVVKAEMTCNIMGQQSALPFFISPMAMIKLANVEGELALARAAGSKGIPYLVSTYSSCSHEEIMTLVRNENLPRQQMFQLYVPRQRQNAEKLIRTARSLGFKALLITVDTPVVGKREEDDRYKARVDYQSGVSDTPQTMDVEDPTQKPVLRGAHSSTLNWDDLCWIREAWGETGPIVLKGIQSAEDALLAYEWGIQGIYLSNHGGRQLDFAPSSLQTLLEIRRFCPEIIGRVEIYLDGGVRRGSDILKALCLGATAVGIGRPFVYALGAYGQQGVEKAIELLSDEIETTMRLLGVTSLHDLSPHYVNTRQLDHLIAAEIDRDSLQFNAKSHL